MKEYTIGVLNAELDNPNMGCNALTLSFLQMISNICEKNEFVCNIILFSSLKDHQIEKFPFKNLNIKSCLPIYKATTMFKFGIQRKFSLIKKFHKSFKSCDVFYEIAGGDSFSDIYGSRRIKNYCKFHNIIYSNNKKLIFLPQTIGPFLNKNNEKIAIKSMQKAVKIYSRDPLTTEYIKNANMKINVFDCIDMVFSLNANLPDHCNKSSKTKVGINPSGLLWNGGYTEKNQFGLKDDYRDLIIKLVEFLLRKEYEVVLIPHVVNGPSYSIEDDYAVINQLKELFPDCIKLNYPYSPVEIKKEIATLDFVIASRMHCCIAAFSLGIPVYPLAYSRKFQGVFNEKMNYKVGSDLKSEDNSEIINKIERFLEEYSIKDMQSYMDILKIENQKLYYAIENDFLENRNES